MKKILLSSLLACVLNVFSQSHPQNWHLNYSAKDTVFGIDLINALKNTPAPSGSKSVIVAIIDGGTDVAHNDLRDNAWVNTKEIAGNAVDDDHNGYIDDINGWDFLGNIAEDIEYDNLEITRLVRNYRIRFGGKTSKDISKADKAEFKRFKKLEEEFLRDSTMAALQFNRAKTNKKYVDKLREELDSDNISLKNLEAFQPNNNDAKLAKTFVVANCVGAGITPKKFFEGIDESYKYFYAQANYHFSTEYDPRAKVGDNYDNIKDLNYGNNEVKGPDADHGTHVAGIVGAVRDNQYPAQGICPLVKLMVLRVVPNGDERDKDVAAAIRYAADNGAKVINMSFGKGFVYNRKAVEEAIRYAESKDVLMVHGAGNDGQNNDEESNFPTPVYEDGTNCKTWIEVGASDRDQNPAGFSNYGKKTVNVFAPGVEIFSTFPDNKYKAIDGTSMASPVVAGLAALIRAYFPHLTAIQVKQVIEASVEQPTKKVKKPGTRKKKTKYSKISTSGGIINADKALKAAAAIK